MKRFLRKCLKLKHNAHYHNQPHKLNRILESKSNSAKRFLRKRFRSFDRVVFETQHNALYESRCGS
ncbi:hypothetical protein [Leptospira noguchii]|uniref:hypothetical protein n=1 Tax=Leptospira noguchii TaxID=28182 RepID=UPI001FB5BF35|nr:hypothetical protein [Leptospira noguchii]UOG30006.1 hypothetical protein MAL06_15495 [Leptospira noguchii]